MKESLKVCDNNVRICEKYALTVTEAAAYFGIGEKKLRSAPARQECWQVSGASAFFKRSQKIPVFMCFCPI